jgi:hypothetical protein
MRARLLSYLRDNRDQIIENWLTETEVPAPIQSIGVAGGTVPYEFFTSAFSAILDILANDTDSPPALEVQHLNCFLGKTCDCRERCSGGRVCLELHESGLRAYMSVFDEDWDAEQEFNERDRAHSKNLINRALSAFFGREIEHCSQKNLRNDCPFVAHH